MFATKSTKATARTAKTPATYPIGNDGRRDRQAARSGPPTSVSWNFGDIRVLSAGSKTTHHAPLPGTLQARLVVAPVNDPLETEADTAADMVMRMGDPAPGLQRKCDACEAEEQDEVQPVARVATARGSVPDATAVPGIVHDVLRTPGQPLDNPAQAFFRDRFRRSFNDVRVHTGAMAAESARSVGALAYTVGRDIVFGDGQYSPGSMTGNRLLAHELAHVEQQRNRLPYPGQRIARQPDPDAEEEKKPAPESEPRQDAGVPTDGATADDAGAEKAAATPDAAAKPSAEPPSHKEDEAKSSPGDAATVTPGEHSAAPAGIAQCPDAPQTIIVVVGCQGTPDASPPAKETAKLPTPDPSPFGGDADRAKFARELAQCRAARVVNDTIDKRFRDAVQAAKTQATEEGKHDTDEAIKTATEGIDPKDKSAIAKAKARATVEAKKAAARKVAGAAAAVKRQDVATVTAELAAAFEKSLSDDYDKTIAAAIKTLGPSWLGHMQSELTNKRARITKEKNLKPKVAKGQQPPPPKSADEIAAEIEAEMFEFRCEQQGWVRSQFERAARAWAIGRREEVDFDTREKAPFLKKFAPTYDPPAKDRVQLPVANPKDPPFAPVAPEMGDFLDQLRADANTPPFRAENRAAHGGGGWAGKGFSVDLYLTNAPHDQRGFWRHDDAVTFLLRLDATAKALGARWRVLYNDFRVAQDVNTATGARNVAFIGGIDAQGKLNWHGPDPFLLHFHLDLEIPQKVAAPVPATP